MRGSRAKRAGGVVLVASIVAAFFGCQAVLGIGDYSVGATDGGGPSTDAPAGDAPNGDGGDGACNSDPSKGCVSCTPASNEDYLNSCPDNSCIPFDSTRLNGLYLSDGGLPPLDGG